MGLIESFDTTLNYMYLKCWLVCPFNLTLVYLAVGGEGIDWIHYKCY